MSEHPPVGTVVPVSLRPYFGHDKVALQGSGGMPAAPPAPPGSPARRAGETALADALSKVGTSGPRIGGQPVVRPPAPALARRMRLMGETALFAASMRDLARRQVSRPPHDPSNPLFRRVFVPVYRAIPWRLKRVMVRTASGARGYRRSL